MIERIRHAGASLFLDVTPSSLSLCGLRISFSEGRRIPIPERGSRTTKACVVVHIFQRIDLSVHPVPNPMKTELPDALLKIAVETALVAGKEILSVYEAGNFSIEAKADKSPLTSADKLAHAVIAAKLEETGVPVLSEEGRAIPYAERAAWTRLWIVDPLDGTKEFISRSGDFTVNIALIDEGQPVLGVIYVPVLDELFFGIVGDGAYKVEGTSRVQEHRRIDGDGHQAASEKRRSQVPSRQQPFAHERANDGFHRFPAPETSRSGDRTARQFAQNLHGSLRRG